MYFSSEYFYLFQLVMPVDIITASGVLDVQIKILNKIFHLTLKKIKIHSYVCCYDVPCKCAESCNESLTPCVWTNFPSLRLQQNTPQGFPNDVNQRWTFVRGCEEETRQTFVNLSEKAKTISPKLERSRRKPVSPSSTF